MFENTCRWHSGDEYTPDSYCIDIDGNMYISNKVRCKTRMCNITTAVQHIQQQNTVKTEQTYLL